MLDPADLEPIVAELVRDRRPRRARARRSGRSARWKNALTAPAQALAAAEDDDEVAAARAYAHYADTLAAYQAVDFDDLIALPGRAASSATPRRARAGGARFAHVLVDEYQDTNPAQYRLFRLLVGADTPFTAVGDDDQAIYGWRGATLDNLAQLPRDYPEPDASIKLEQNYRSTARILRSANALIANNPKLFDKKLWSELGLGDTMRVAPAADDEAEAEMVVARHLARTASSIARSYADYAILYRGNHQARAFETALRARAVPYDVSGGTVDFDRAEIRDIVAYLRLIANEDDDPAFVRAATTPRRGIGATTLARLGEIGAARDASLFAAAFEPGIRGARCRRASAKRSPSSARWSTACAIARRASRRDGCSAELVPRSATRTSSSRRSTSATPPNARRACAISSTGWRARARPTAATCSS